MQFHSTNLSKKLLIINYVLLIILSSCSVSKKISRSADKIFFSDTIINTGHIGISIYEPATDQYWYDHNASKYFVPASNTKLFTLYAGMKYLGDSLVGLKVTEFANALFISASGDPTLLHTDFKKHPVYDFLAGAKKQLWANDYSWKENALGKGWSWDDFNDPYMAERSALPIYGNVIRFSGTKKDTRVYPIGATIDKLFSTTSKDGATGYIDKVSRDPIQNIFKLNIDGRWWKEIQVPFLTSGTLAFQLLADSLHKRIIGPNEAPPDLTGEPNPLRYTIHSQPVDSVLQSMMHRSDNFFAEQILLMASNEKLGYMNDEDIIDTLLNNDLATIPQKPNWVDGSGLSRYNLFTPQSFIFILNKMKNEFGMERLKVILPTGGEGTLAAYYRKDSGFIYAKTGTLSNQTALSGFLITQKNKLLIFSILVNNFQGTTAPVKKAIEQFLVGIRAKY